MTFFRRSSTFALFLAPLLAVASCQVAPKQDDAASFNQDVETTVENISAKNPKLASMFSSAYGYAVFPVVGEGGLLLAGGFGRGAVYENGTLVGYARVDEHSIGAVAGGEKWTLLIFFENSAAFKTFTAGKFALDAKANAVAATAGESTTTNYSKGVYLARVDPAGLMGNASAGFSNYQYMSLADADQMWRKDAEAKAKNSSGSGS